MKRILGVLILAILLIGLNGARCRATAQFEQEDFAHAVIETLQSKVKLGIPEEVANRAFKALIKDNRIDIPLQILLDAAYKLEAVLKKNFLETNETIAQESCLLQDKLAKDRILGL